MSKSKEWSEVTKEELYKLYHVDLFSLVDIGNMYGVHMEAVRRKMIKFKIPRFNISQINGFNNGNGGFHEADMEEAVSSLKQLGKFKPSYTKVAKENISIPIPLKSVSNILNGKHPKATATLILSDLHVGHTDFLPETYDSAVETLKKVYQHLQVYIQ